MPDPSARPSYDELAVLPAYNPLTVPPEFEDLNGHMNIAHYLTTAGWGVEFAYRDTGLTADRHLVDQLGTFTAEQHLVYLSEVLVGSEVSVRVRFLARSARALHAQAYLLDDTHGRLSYTMEIVTIHIDFATRRTTPWPDAVAAAFDARIAEHAALPWAAPLSGCMGVR